VAFEKEWNMSQVFENAVLVAHPLYEVTTILGEHGRDAVHIKVNGASVAYVRFAQRNILASVECTVVVSGQGQPSTRAIADALGTRVPATTKVRSGTPVRFTTGGVRVALVDFMIAADNRPEMLENYMRRASKHLDAISECLRALRRDVRCPTCGQRAASISVWAPDHIVTETEFTCAANHSWEP
jgi:RNA polymerase subunit RPABC4/transcription elongation factor Spt4